MSWNADYFVLQQFRVMPVASEPCSKYEMAVFNSLLTPYTVFIRESTPILESNKILLN